MVMDMSMDLAQTLMVQTSLVDQAQVDPKLVALTTMVMDLAQTLMVQTTLVDQAQVDPRLVALTTMVMDMSMDLAQTWMVQTTFLNRTSMDFFVAFILDIGNKIKKQIIYKINRFK